MAGRKHYDWLFIIKDWKLEKEFYHYKKIHPKVKSEKRLARSFVKSKHIPLCDAYILGKCRSAFKVARVSWIGL